ncbi:hypothetical protein MD484_g5082, partial [Candolleomyces efflorescens]
MSGRRLPTTPTPTVVVPTIQYPAVSYALDEEQLLSISAALLDSGVDMPPPPRNLDDVPEEDFPTAADSNRSGPYTNQSAANSATTFHAGPSAAAGGGSGSGRNTPIPGSSLPSSARLRKAPSTRTLGKPSTDQLQVAATASGSGSSGGGAAGGNGSSGASIRRAGSASSASVSRSSRAQVGAGGHTLNRYRSTPRLPHDKEMAPAPATGMYWSKAPVWGTLPSRSFRNHSATLVDTVVWIIGGNDDKESARDIYCFDTETMQWTRPDTVGESPPACRAQTATLVDKKIVIYGGGLGSYYFDGVYVLDTATRRWSQPPILDGPHPAGRRAHTAVYYDNKIWIFGGGNGLNALNDVWTLDLGSNHTGLVEGTEGRGLRWEEKITTTVKPCPRGYHTANLVRDIMVMVGGSDGKECFTDIWLLNLTSLIWSKVNIPPPLYKRLSHSATQVGSYLFIVGGHTGSEYTSEILLLNLVSLHYEPRTIYGKPPSPRGNHSSVLSDSRLFLFGGFNGQISFDDVYILDLAASAYLPQVTSFEIESGDPNVF